MAGEHPESGRDESSEERADRNLRELLEELRVALPGVQVLFAFLLTVPFAQRFATVTPFQQKVYFATLLCAATASLFLIAPSAHHRVQFRQQDKAHIVKVASRLAIVGLVALALAMIGVLMLITDLLFSSRATAIVAAVAASAFALLWFVYPAARRISQAGDG
jgi:hypothetical protein